MSEDNSTLIFKNIPKQIGDMNDFLNALNIPPKIIKSFGRKRALLTYNLRCEAEHALSSLREKEFSGRSANVAFFCKDKSRTNKKENVKPLSKTLHKSVQTINGATQLQCSVMPQQISKYVQKLYATETELGFNQPPPPYLKYCYPPINKDILDNICICLLSNKRFYTQVLHLMNRMNLEPPFTERKYKFTPPGMPKETGTQTDDIIKVLPVQSGQVTEEEIETEMESSEDESNEIRAQPQLKRKLPTQPEQYKKKARQILQIAQKLSKEIKKRPSAGTNLSIMEVFEAPQHSSASTAKIELQLKSSPKVVESKQAQKQTLILPPDLKMQKLSASEFENLAVYKNYQKGEVSNKLYIKNLHKDVSLEDLTLIYERYVNAKNLNLDIKVMQHGRMKGQAFVTFQSDEMEMLKPIVAQALDDTNGFILRDKPMVVCYGKQS